MEQKKAANINIREPKKTKADQPKTLTTLLALTLAMVQVKYPVTLSLNLLRKRGPITIIKQPVVFERMVIEMNYRHFRNN